MSLMGAALVGGGLGLLGSSSASKRNAKATRAAIDEQRRQYDTTRGDLMPWMGAGQNALGAYQSALGLGGGYNASASAPMSFDAWSAANPPQDTGRTQREVYWDDRGEQQTRTVPVMSEVTRDGYNQYLKKFHTGKPAAFGSNELGGYKPSAATGASGERAPAFEFNLEADQGYNFARDQAMQEVERAMAARGFNRSGNVLNALSDRATGMASQYANDAFNRQLIANNTAYGRDQDYLNRLANLSGSGQNAAARLGGFGANTANAIGNLGVAGAANQGNLNMMGAGIVNQAVQGYMQNSLLDKYMKPPPPAAYGYGGFR